MSAVERFQQLEAHASSLIIGQSHLINRMLVALSSDHGVLPLPEWLERTGDTGMSVVEAYRGM